MESIFVTRTFTMVCSESDSLPFIRTTVFNGPYHTVLASASSSTASVWSDASSQLSDDTTLTAPTSNSSEPCDPYCHSQPSTLFQAPNVSCDQVKAPASWVRQTQLQTAVEVPRELRQNPRRTSNSAVAKSGRPPVLTRQSDRKGNFVDNLVGKP